MASSDSDAASTWVRPMPKARVQGVQPSFSVPSLAQSTISFDDDIQGVLVKDPLRLAADLRPAAQHQHGDAHAVARDGANLEGGGQDGVGIVRRGRRTG